MRIFILGRAATGSLLAQLLERQGHVVCAGSRPRARRAFWGIGHPVTTVNARNLRAIVKAAKGCQLIVNDVGVGVQPDCDSRGCDSARTISNSVRT